ncbi:MAG: TonB-dependent receptor, partial [Bryobacterales bacterium]|nr:TonB-dependent receptor [Bryobacterales bacterium]
FQGGYQSQFVHVKEYDYSGTIPQYTLGISASSSIGLTSTQLPGISASALADANSLLATVAGIVTSAAQTFNVTSRTSGFVPGAPNARQLTNNSIAFYGQDNWKIFKNLTLTLGVRYEYYSPVNEIGGLALIPRLENGNPIQTLLDPNAVLDFAGGNTGRSLYKSDRNNFAPNVGLAWDVFGNGRTAFRAGYSINFVNDEFLRATENNAIATNSGLVSNVTLSDLSTTAGKLPAISAPVLQIPRTTADNYALDSTNAVALPDPNLVTPYVQQWNVGIQQQIKGFVVDVRYVGNHGTKLFRSIDYNQVIIRQNGFLADFLRAQNNGALAAAAGKGFNPVYNPAIAGSQQLTVFPHLTNGGFLSNSTVRNDIQTGQVGGLAELYAVDALNGSVQFFQNPNALGADLLTNYSNSTYNGLQMDVSHRFANGLSAQANYVFSKVLSDAAGDGQTRFEPFLDINNAKLEKSRAPFNQTHVFKANYIYELPFGTGKRFDLGRMMNRILGGFSTSGIITWSSGSPFSFFSGRATLNRAGGSRSANNTADSSLTAGQINNLLGLRFNGNGVYYIANSAINPDDGRGVAPDGSPAFTGQVFSNPTAGNVGTLSKDQFNGPGWFAFDAGVQKTTKVTERLSVELRAEAINVLNHPTFFVGDQSINNTDFGVVGNSLLAPRVVQFGLYVKF